MTISERAWGLPRREMRNRAGPKFENSYQKLNVTREQSNPSYDQIHDEVKFTILTLVII